MNLNPWKCDLDGSGLRSPGPGQASRQMVQRLGRLEQSGHRAIKDLAIVTGAEVEVGSWRWRMGRLVPALLPAPTVAIELSDSGGTIHRRSLSGIDLQMSLDRIEIDGDALITERIDWFDSKVERWEPDSGPNRWWLLAVPLAPP